VIAVLLVAWLAALAARPLYRPDEARYGEIPREMVASGDWLTPRLNGYKYFEKPPLQYWASALAFAAFGVSDWAARLWTGLTALGGVLLVFFAGRRLFGERAGLYGAAVLASCPLYLLLGQANTLDMGLTFFFTAAVLAFVLGQVEHRRWMLGFWAACACAVLSKGLIGIVLPAGAVGLYVLVRRDWRLLARLELLRGGALFLLVAAPWFVAVSLANQEFAHFFFVQEHWQRFTTHLHHRSQPAWYFIPVLILGLWPWILAVLVSWPGALRTAGERFSPKLFLLVWALVVFVFFSASGSKLPPYILPLVPALALLAGESLARQARPALFAAQCVLAAVGALALGGAAWKLGEPGDQTFRALAHHYVPWLAAAASVGVAGAIAACVLALRKRDGAAIGMLATAVVAALLVAVVGHRVLSPAYSVKSLAPQVPPSARVFTVETYDHSMPWSLGRAVTMVGYTDELAQAIGWEPRDFIPDRAGFARAWKGEREAYAFFAVRDFERLRRELDLPMEVAARGPRYVLVRKP
jgi:4-amino-4-deoxy-L-arabinose transferase-like glycosyltransferase